MSLTPIAIPDGTSGGPASKKPYSFVHTDEQRERATAAFEKALDDAVPVEDVARLGLLNDVEDEMFIRREVERMLYEQKLPNGGHKERKMIERLRDLVAKADKEWIHLERALHAISQWNLVLPANPRNAGRYYTRRALTPKTDKQFFEEMTFLKEAAQNSKEWGRKWFAQMMLDGLPEAVSDFEMECLFLLRKNDGSVTRLVRLQNMVGESSRGEHQYGAVILDEDAFASAEKFRKWCLRWGNFNWSGNMTALHHLHEDIGRLSAWRVINQVDSVGWHPVKRHKP